MEDRENTHKISPEELGEFHIFVHREPWFGAISFLLCAKQLATNIPYHAKIVGWEKTDPVVNTYQDATFRLRPDHAQELMDYLWEVGLRPTNGVGSVGQLQATEKHLEDMRKIAFGFLGKNAS